MNVESILRAYFHGEKSEAALILLAGVVCLVAAVWLWFWIREPFARGLAGSLLLVAALGLGVGGSVYFRTDGQVRELVELQRADPARFAAEEEPRIRPVVRVLVLLVFVVRGPTFHGLAVGLLVLAAMGLTIDYYAEARAVRYVGALETAGAIPGP